MKKTAHWHHLCQTNEKYRSAWDAGVGPAQLLPGSVAQKVVHPPGPGTELKKLLGCCSFPYVQRLNEWGPDECENRLEEIVAMLLKKSCKTKNGLTDHSARRMVRLAIEKSRRAMV